VCSSDLRVVDGGIPQVRFSGTCGTGGFLSANALDRQGGRLVIGGDDDGLCELNIATNQFTMLQAPGSGSSRIADLYVAPGGEVFYVTTDGYIGKQGVGRITQQLDPNGMNAVDGLSGDDVWAIGDQGGIYTLGTDGGFQLFTMLPNPAYALRVTTDGVFVSTYGGLAYKTRFTDGGFDFWGIPVDPNNRPWQLTGGPGAIHVIGDEGPISNQNGVYYFTLIPQTR
jgi:hypothetical protein